MLGADHHGYAARLKAAAQALGFDPERIEIALYQMVHLIEDGEQKRMSKRRGDVVLLDELMDGIGVDAARFYLVQRSHDATIDIDLAQAVEQGPKNPVYYVQYAHARICSILRRAGAIADAAPDDATAPEPSEAALVRALVEFPEVCRAAVELRAPHRVVVYARDLASAFSAFYRDCPVIDAETPALRSSASRSATRRGRCSRARSTWSASARRRRCRSRPRRWVGGTTRSSGPDHRVEPRNWSRANPSIG